MNNTIEYKGYTGNVEFSSRTLSLHGKVLGISTSITYEGSSVDEIKANFREAVDNYLNSCKEEGIEPEKPFEEDPISFP